MKYANEISFPHTKFIELIRESATKCLVCGGSPDLAHHIIQKIQHPDNLVVICNSCHSVFHSLSPFVFDDTIVNKIIECYKTKNILIDIHPNGLYIKYKNLIKRDDVKYVVTKEAVDFMISSGSLKQHQQKHLESKLQKKNKEFWIVFKPKRRKVVDNFINSEKIIKKKVTKRKKPKRFSRRSLEALVESDNTPKWLREYWSKQLKNSPNRQFFEARKK